MGIKILLADDHEIIRDGLRSLIEKQPGMQVVAEAENGQAAIKMNRKFRPDMIVMDIHMPELNGIEATRRIVAEFPGAKVIVFSMYSDQQFVIGALKAGVSGYLLKDSASEELARAIRAVADNRLYLCPQVKGTVAEACRKEDVPERINNFCRLMSIKNKILIRKL
jgi:DNA-binding NarL/FixJ family response regulator